MSEALIFASTDPQYGDRLFIFYENCKLRISEEDVVYTKCCFCFDIQNNFGTQHVLQMLRASEKDLPVRPIILVSQILDVVLPLSSSYSSSPCFALRGGFKIPNFAMGNRKFPISQAFSC